MAGIGFELNKLFKRKGLLSIIKAYGYAGMVCTGPFLLGVSLLLGVRVIGTYFGMSEHNLGIVNGMVTMTLVLSILFTSGIAMVTTRYIADQLYDNREERILPAFFGSVSIPLIVGGIGYAIVLFITKVPFLYAIECFLFLEFTIVVWTEMSFLTAIKDYRGILKVFAFSTIIGLLTGIMLMFFTMDRITALLLSVCVAYGVMAVWYYILLIHYFPVGMCSCLDYLRWFNQYPQLFFVGTFVSMGLLGHLVIMWSSPANQHLIGPFYATPVYDIAAIFAFMSTLVTTVNFVTSVEVNFYPKYRNYFALFNDGGSYTDIKQAEREMLNVLKQELTYTFTKQFFVTILFIVGGTLLLPELPLGITEDILGIYRILCIGYALYAISNCIMLIQLYFTDNQGALLSSGAFMLSSCILTWLLKGQSMVFYGFGFLIGGIVYFLVAFILLSHYLTHIIYKELCNQPLVIKSRTGLLTRISNYYWVKFQERYHIVPTEFQEMEEEST